MSAKNCGSCKWLDVEAKYLTKTLRTHKRYDFSAFPCRVPFTLPPFPACFDVRIVEKRYSCPYYGTECAFYEQRTTSEQRSTASGGSDSSQDK